MNKDFLPSKQFVRRIVIIISIIAIIFSVSQLVKFLRNRSIEKSKIPTKILVKNIVQRDSNDNGVPDWEESLWGLNPNKDGEKNKEFIDQKRAILGQENTVLDNISESNAVSAENEALARDFFALVMSLEQSGELTEENMASISNLIGKKIETTPINDIYLASDLKVKADSADNLSLYYNDLKKLTEKYQDADIGEELNLISQGLVNENPQATEVAIDIALAYQSFGQELIEISVPNSLSERHLSLANNYEKTGESLMDMTKLLSDPITGMKALINYKKYSDALVSDWEYMAEKL